MLNDIAPGDTVTVKITKTPTNVAGRKTLQRVLCKDAGHAAEVRRHRDVRDRNTPKSTRGGRWRVWEGRMVKQHPVHGTAGEQGTVTASYDVLQDLKSVERFIEVQKA